MAYFPLYVDIENKKCVVVGGGRIAAGKIRQLASFGADITVVAPAVCGEVRALAKEPGILLRQQHFAAEDIADAALVVAATDDGEVNRLVSALCREAKIPVNVVDEKELCSFYFPAIVHRGDVVVAVSTGGDSPALAARLRRELETCVPERYGMAAETLGAFRETVKAQVPQAAARKRVFERLLELFLARDALSDEEVRAVIAEETGIKGEERDSKAGKKGIKGEEGHGSCGKRNRDTGEVENRNERKSAGTGADGFVY